MMMTRSASKRHSLASLKPLETMGSDDTERTASDESASSAEQAAKANGDATPSKRSPEDEKVKSSSASSSSIKRRTSTRGLKKASSSRKFDDESREDPSKCSSSSSSRKESSKKHSSSSRKHSRRVSTGEAVFESSITDTPKPKHNRRASAGPYSTIHTPSAMKEKCSLKQLSSRSEHTKKKVARSSSCRELLGSRKVMEDAEKAATKSKGRGLSKALSSLDLGRSSEDSTNKTPSITKDFATNSMDGSSRRKPPPRTLSRLEQGSSTGSINSTSSNKSSSKKSSSNNKTETPSSKPSRGIMSRSSSARHSLRQIMSQQDDSERVTSSGSLKKSDEEEKPRSVSRSRSSRTSTLKSLLDKPKSGDANKSSESSAGNRSIKSSAGSVKSSAAESVTKEEPDRRKGLLRTRSDRNSSRSLVEMQVSARDLMAEEKGKENQEAASETSAKTEKSEKQEEFAASRPVPDRRGALMRTRSDRNSMRSLAEMRLSARDLMAGEQKEGDKTDSAKKATRPTHVRGRSAEQEIQPQTEEAQQPPETSEEPDRRKNGLLRTKSDRHSMRDLMQVQLSARDLMADASDARFDAVSDTESIDAPPSMPTRSTRSSGKSSKKERARSKKISTC